MSTLAQRFWAKVDRSGGSDACWPWTARKHRFGYGLIRADSGGLTLRAHRVSWELTNGPIPEGTGYHGTCVLHRCDNPRCVNPAHLFLGTAADNSHDMSQKGRAWRPTGQRNGGGRRNRAKTHCLRGHPYSHDNTYFARNGGRLCRACHKGFARTRREAQRAPLTPTQSHDYAQA